MTISPWLRFVWVSETVDHFGSAILNFKIFISSSYSATSKSEVYKVSLQSKIFFRKPFAILGPPFWISQFRFQIRIQRPQKPKCTKFSLNQRFFFQKPSAILGPPFWILQFRFQIPIQRPPKPKCTKFRLSQRLFFRKPSAILSPPFWILEFRFQIPIQRPLKPKCTKFRLNQRFFFRKLFAVSVRHFEFHNFDLKFVFSDFKNRSVQSLA